MGAEALERIGALYAVEEHIRQHKLKPEAKREYRLEHAKPSVESFFAWVQHTLDKHGLLPANPMTKALAYARNRRVAGRRQLA